ncbi:MAG: DUF5720 family protein [Oscillospiraceae bacterium]|jgi:hypothetical protein|nr:DUF5720 family protein [Oscillospiraceae bacterium]
MGEKMQKRIADAKAGRKEPEIKGQAVDDIMRFADDTRHMIIFDVLDHACPVGDKGERLRVFLSDEGYTDTLASQGRSEMKILRHARVKDGALSYDTPGKAFE